MKDAEREHLIGDLLSFGQMSRLRKSNEIEAIRAEINELTRRARALKPCNETTLRKVVADEPPPAVAHDWEILKDALRRANMTVV